MGTLLAWVGLNYESKRTMAAEAVMGWGALFGDNGGDNRRVSDYVTG